MIFKKTYDFWYPYEYYLSDNEEFSIGVTQELFRRFKIQVLYREIWTRDGKKKLDIATKWWVISEWVTYDERLKNIQVATIIANLKDVNYKAMEFVEGEASMGWRMVEERLPDKSYKYLEDEYKDLGVFKSDA